MSTGDNGTGHNDLPSVDVNHSRTSPPTAWVMASPRWLVLSLLLLGAILVIAGISITGVGADEHRQEGSWSPGGRLQADRGDMHTATKLQDGRVLLVGGNSSPRSAEIWDSETRETRLVAPLEHKRMQHTATRLEDGRVLVVGTGWPPEAANTAEVYDPARNEWTSAGPLNASRGEGHTATLMGDGRVLVTGGDGGEGPLASAEVYDPGDGEWTSTGSMEDPRMHHTAMPLDDGRVLVTGGDTGDDSSDPYSSSAQLFDPANDEWTTVDSMGYERAEHAATILSDGRVLVAGGDGGPAPRDLEDGSDDIFADSITDLAVWGFSFSQDQTFEFTIEGEDLPAGGEVTIGLDEAQGSGAVQYSNDDEDYTSSDGVVTATVDDGSAQLSFMADETVTAGSTVVVEGDRAATTNESAARPRVVFDRLDTGGSDATTFFVGPYDLRSMEVFNPSDGTWAELAPLSEELAGTDTLETLNNGTVFAPHRNESWRYDPGDDEWWMTAESDQSHHASSSTLLDDGHVLLAGGSQGDLAEVYSPDTMPPPVVSSVTPERGSVEGGFEVTITGENLADTVFVSFGEGDYRVGDVIEDSSEQVRVQAPSHPAEWAPVRVVTPGGTSESDETVQVEFVANDGDWAPTGDMAQARDTAGTIILDGPTCDGDERPDYCGQVLVVSGESSELYDPEEGRFHSVALLPASFEAERKTVLLDGPVCRGDSAPAYCGKVLVLNEDVSEAALYDPDDNRWEACGGDGFDCPPALDEQETSQWKAAELLDGPECHDPDGGAPDHCGTVLAAAQLPFGGDTPPEMWLFDPESGSWSETGSASEPRSQFVMTLVDGAVCDGEEPPQACGDVLISSGVENVAGEAIRTETAELYDPVDGQWRDTAEEPPTPGRKWSTATTMPDGRVLIAGGQLDFQGPIAQVDLFNPADESWDPVPAMPDGRKRHSAVALADGRAMIAGGETVTPAGSEEVTSSVLVFDPDAGAEGEWAYTDSMLDERAAERSPDKSGFPLVALPDGRVLAASGRDENGDQQTSAELYELNPGAVAGNVTDADTGDPIEGAEIAVTDADGEQVGSGTTESNGSYRVSVPFGEYTVTADAEGFQAQSRDGVTVNAGETTMAEFALTPETDSGGGGGGTGGDDTTDDDTTDDTTTDAEEPGSITGTVSDADTGDAIAGAEITVLEGGTTVVTAGTDEQGAYTVTGLDPGDYTLTVEAEGFASASQDVTVESGETITASFSLDPATEVGDVEGTVTDAETGDPAVGAEITVLDGDTTVVTAGTDVDGSYFVRNLQPGDYTVTVEADGFEPASQTVTVAAGDTTTADFALQPVGVAPAGLTSRIAGADRFATAAELSAQRFDSGVEVAYVATGLEFADALTGGVAAALDDGPVLLAATDTLPQPTASELDRLDPQRIVLLGGTAALSDMVETAVAEFTDGSVDRLAGADRFATAAEVSGALFPDGADTVYVGTGLNFPDVLAGGPAAAGAPGPMLLTTGDTVPQPTADELDRLDPDRMVILGGTAAVGEAVEAELADHGTVDRIGGAGRFATAAQLSASEFADAAAVNRVYVATGFEFADALAAGAVAGSEDVPVLLVTTDSVPEPTAAELGRLDPDEVVVMGGTAAVADSVEQQLTQLLGG